MFRLLYLINRVNILFFALFLGFSSIAFSQVDENADSTANGVIVDDFVDLDSLQSESENNDNLNSSSTSNLPKPVLNSESEEESDEFIFKPQVSIGTGMLTFYGDVGTNHQGYHPMVSRLATTLRLINPLNDYLDVGFYVMFGEISANERTIGRNLNFNSNITTGGITLNYNFNHFLKKDRIADPYFHIGLESIEFLSKTDLKDKNNNTYYYWVDGTIRDIAEDDPNAGNAVELNRDYTYESDVRAVNDSLFGKYPERSWGVPLEIGANLRVSDRLNFRVGTAVHFTFTDLIDGVTDLNLGNSRNDKMLFTHIAVSYDFNIKKKDLPESIIPEDDPYKYHRIDTVDSDGDMVIDFADKCANTPKGVEVDDFGCPIDGDGDGVINTNDDELATPEGSPVDMRGVGLDSADYLLAFRKYKDSIGEFARWDTLRRSWGSNPRSLKKIIDTKNLTTNKQLFIVIGSDVQGVTASNLWKKLANKDFQVRESGDSVLYVLGGFTEEELVQKIEEIQQDTSISIVDVVEIVDDEIKPVEVPEKPVEIPEETDTSLVPLMVPSSEVSFRIQIGAFRNKLSKSVFRELPKVVSVFGDDSLYRFFSGSFSDKTEAASHKINLSTSGYNDAFIVAFKDGKRITLKEAGFEMNPDYKDNIEIDTIPSVNPINAKLVKFRVQVGAYKEKIPTDALDMYLDIGNVLPKRDIMSGLTKYYLGEFSNYDVAADFRLKLIDKGLIDCFVVGEFKNNIISTKEAQSLLGQ
ncbi:MAG: SPOR domain-containing protein [Flavobacteriales bacterium]|nr:SPOR domain-containing protein [Flavobacteriales bacterium]